MGAEFLYNKALLDMCYKISARTSILYVCTRRPDLRSTPIIPLQNDYQYPGLTSLVPVSTPLGRE